MTRIQFLLLASVLTAASCSTSGAAGKDDGMIRGVVKYIDLEGGFYGMVVGEEKFLPVNLPEEFKQDGLEVVFKYRRTKRLMTTVQWGIPIDVTHIQKQ